MSKVFSSENFYHTTIPVQHSESVAATAHNKTPIQNAFYVYTTYSNGKQTWYFILYCQARCKKQWNWIKVVGLHTNRWGRNIMYVNPFKCPKIKTESHKTYDTESGMHEILHQHSFVIIFSRNLLNYYESVCSVYIHICILRIIYSALYYALSNIMAGCFLLLIKLLLKQKLQKQQCFYIFVFHININTYTHLPN